METQQNLNSGNRFVLKTILEENKHTTVSDRLVRYTSPSQGFWCVCTELLLVKLGAQGIVSNYLDWIASYPRKTDTVVETWQISSA